MKRLILMPMLVIGFSFAALAQQPSEQRAALTDAAIAFDTKSAPALEARLRTQVLNGSDDSPVTNVKIAVKNVTPSFYTYVSGWATFYDSNAVRCGEGLFKLDAQGLECGRDQNRVSKGDGHSLVTKRNVPRALRSNRKSPSLSF